MLWLLVDDCRDINCDVIARNAKAARQVLQNLRGQIECLCLDHDLGEAESGYDLLKWADQQGLLPNRVQLVTSNPVGRANMAAHLVRCGFSTNNNVEFVKRG